MEAVPGDTHASAGWGPAVSWCRAFGRIQVFYLHLSHTITAERLKRAFACRHVASRIAGNPNRVRQRRPSIAIVALENRPILDEIGSAVVAR
jgi:type 1 glutamine amidotransferase